ncbi:transcription initiation factor TFIID subunit 4B-like [Protopterus annectens]|uniref:transcription initiation factor TFIID subunit 4B-like n=1 Tax=Protopterus annectens TaxID=7888 RepID=UPI001CF9C82D|nr:transcription initiation factor TFIID subunit 4B-like [Protopterus annectens]
MELLGTVLLRSDNGQLMLVSQEDLARAQAQVQVQGNGSIRAPAPTCTPAVQISAVQTSSPQIKHVVVTSVRMPSQPSCPTVSVVRMPAVVHPHVTTVPVTVTPVLSTKLASSAQSYTQKITFTREGGPSGTVSTPKIIVASADVVAKSGSLSSQSATFTRTDEPLTRTLISPKGLITSADGAKSGAGLSQKITLPGADGIKPGSTVTPKIFVATTDGSKLPSAVSQKIIFSGSSGKLSSSIVAPGIFVSTADGSRQSSTIPQKFTFSGTVGSLSGSVVAPKILVATTDGTKPSSAPQKLSLSGTSGNISGQIIASKFFVSATPGTKPASAISQNVTLTATSGGLSTSSTQPKIFIATTEGAKCFSGVTQNISLPGIGRSSSGTTVSPKIFVTAEGRQSGLAVNQNISIAGTEGLSSVPAVAQNITVATSGSTTPGKGISQNVTLAGAEDSSLKVTVTKNLTSLTEEGTAHSFVAQTTASCKDKNIYDSKVGMKVYAASADAVKPESVVIQGSSAENSGISPSSGVAQKITVTDELKHKDSLIQKFPVTGTDGTLVADGVGSTLTQKDQSVEAKPMPVNTKATAETSTAVSATQTTHPQEVLENVKKCRNFLATLIKLASSGSQSANMAQNVKNLVQNLLEAKIEPEDFTSKLYTELKSSPQPFLVPFLKRSLPALRQLTPSFQGFMQQCVQHQTQPKTTGTVSVSSSGTGTTQLVIKQPGGAILVNQLQQPNITITQQTKPKQTLEASQTKTVPIVHQIVPNSQGFIQQCVPQPASSQTSGTILVPGSGLTKPQLIIKQPTKTAIPNGLHTPSIDLAQQSKARPTLKLSQVGAQHPRPLCPRVMTLPQSVLTIQKPSAIQTTAASSVKQITIQGNKTSSFPACATENNKVKEDGATSFRYQRNYLAKPNSFVCWDQKPSQKDRKQSRKRLPNGTTKYSKSGKPFPDRDEDDINDVTFMAGVNLSEESARILATNSNLVGTTIRSCTEEPFLSITSLQKKILEMGKKHDITEVNSDVMNLVSCATAERLRALVEKVTAVAQHRMISYKDDDKYVLTSDTKAQLKFFEQLDHVEKQRREEEEKEMLLRAAKSRTNKEDPEHLRLKQKAKEMQQLEMAQIQQRDANLAALAAIGPRKKRSLEFLNQVVRQR